jgi:Protein of unknown function (DUF3551)
MGCLLTLKFGSEIAKAEVVFMRMKVVFAVIFATLLSTVAAHADGSWCANYNGGNGTNCGFHSFEQCQATVSGIGGFCSRNPFSAGNGIQTRNRYRR